MENSFAAELDVEALHGSWIGKGAGAAGVAGMRS
jgi:hypothetical protein